MNKHFVEKVAEHEFKMGYITVQRAADYIGKTYQALRQAMTRGNLKYMKKCGIYFTTVDWLVEYEADKYNRFNTLVDGKRVFDLSEGRYNTDIAAKILDVPLWKLYEYIEEGTIKTTRVADYHVIDSKEIDKMRV